MAMKQASNFLVRHGGGDVVYLAAQRQLHSAGDDPRHLGVEDLARKTIHRDPVAHHPAGRRRSIPDLDFVAEPAQVVGGREAARAGANDQDALAGRRRRRREVPIPAQSPRSPRKRSTELMPTASSSLSRLQAVSHGW